MLLFGCLHSQRDVYNKMQPTSLSFCYHSSASAATLIRFQKNEAVKHLLVYKLHSNFINEIKISRNYRIKM